MSGVWIAAFYATLAGAAIPLGALLARVEHIGPAWLEEELRHGIMAFGGGALLAAIALVLVPEGSRHLPLWAVLSAFGAGGVAFFLADRLIERRGGAGAQLMAMLLDFVPESMAMGAMFAADEPVGVLLAILIALQNFPEGFNAYREVVAAGRMVPGRALKAFCLLVLLGPLATWVGFAALRDLPELLGRSCCSPPGASFT